MIEEPTVKQKTNMRVFAGFTPQQVEKLLTSKGLKPNSREAAVYLSAMSDKAEQMLMDSQVKAFQYGGSVGGFDDKSTKLFDAAVKRSASTDPKSPEVQRYIDNVIETRGRPTMVYPTTADPLQGYQVGGPVRASMGMVIDKDGRHIGYDSGPAVVDEQGNYMGGGGLGTPGFMPLPGFDKQGKPIEGYTPPPPRTGPPDLRAQYEVGSFTNDMMGVGTPVRGTGRQMQDRTVVPATSSSNQNKQIEEYAQNLLATDALGRGLTPQEALIEARRQAQEAFKQAPVQDPFYQSDAYKKYQQSGGFTAQVMTKASDGREFGNPALAAAYDQYLKSPQYRPPPTIEADRPPRRELTSNERYMDGIGVVALDKRTGQYSDGKGNYYNAKGESVPYRPSPTFPGFPFPMPPDRRDPLPTPPTTKQPIVADVKAKLNEAQATLSEEQGKVSALQQQLANTPLDDEEGRKAIIEQINEAMPLITRAEAAVANASQAFQSSAVPTAAEAVGATVSSPADMITRQPVDKMRVEGGQIISPTSGQVSGDISVTGTTATTSTADAPTPMIGAEARVTKTVNDVRNYVPQERFGEISKNAIVNAQTVATEDLNIRDVLAAQGTGQQVTSPSARALKQGELVSGAANAEKASQFLEGIEAATGSPSSAATVQGQLTNLMADFEGGTPPPWAAGAMRQATAIMAQRGMAASSMAGQAIVQAAMESALPIAMQDAQTVARFEEQNLSNRQQRAMLSAQQRATFLGMEFDQEFQARVQNASKISDIANMNFSAEQQIALENARLAQTVDLTNLSNRQAIVMAQASAIAQADMANLNNRQQAAVQNAMNFLQMDMRNLDISQQADMFKNQSVIQSLFTDASAQNAASQFNASSENQTNQFFANLRTQVQQFNSAQSNAMNQFNAKEDNALEIFQEQINNQRDQFNAQNQLIIAQANAQWRQQLATINNAALNDANRQNALQANNLTQKGLDEIWQKERDLMAYAFASAESAAGRRQELILSDLKAEVSGDNSFMSALGGFASAIVGGIFDNPKYFFGKK